MRDWVRKNKFYIGAFFLLLVQSIIILPNLYIGTPITLLWFCNHVPLLFSLGLLFNKKDFLKGIINIGLIPQFFWVIDFFGKLIFDVYVFDVTRYIFEDFSGLNLVGSVIAHLFSSLVVLLFVFRYATRKRVLLYSGVYILLLFGLSILLTTTEENINLVYRMNVWNVAFPGYTFLWPIMVFVLIALPTYFLQVFLYNRRDTFLRKS